MSDAISTESPKARAHRGSKNRLDDGPDHPQAEAREPARQAVRTPVSNGRAVAYDRDGNPISRQRDNTIDQFDIPAHLKEDGWDYQWNVKSVLGEEKMAAQIRDAENGWRPVPSDRAGFQGRFMPPGYKGPIERDGLVLCERPMLLTEQARQEDRYNANAQRMQNRERFGLPSVPDGFDDHHPSLGKFGKGKPGVRVGIEGAPSPDGKYQMAIDDE